MVVMSSIVWATDIHLNFAKVSKVIEFCNELKYAKADALILTGDISDAPSLQEHLLFLNNRLEMPIYFVLGNHDFYHSSIEYVRNFIRDLSMDYPKLTWLSENGIIPLTANTCLIGHDGWCDGRYGNYISSIIMLNDYRLISDFLGMSRAGILDIIQSQALRATNYIKEVLLEAVTLFDNIILATHVPPFAEACLYNGKISGEHWLPHFTCKIMGDLLKNVMRANPQCKMTILCGHSHSEAEVNVLPNLKVQVGYAKYSYPSLNKVITLKEIA